MELKITINEVSHEGYCSDAGEEEHSITTTTIRVPVLRLSPEFRKNFDEHTMTYTGKYGKELYDELVAVKLLRMRYSRILMAALHDNSNGVSCFETSCGHGSGYCAYSGEINIHSELTY
jgi:hypothetical protein